MDQIDEAKLLAALLGVLKKENSRVKDELLKEIYGSLQKDIQDQTGVKYLELDEVENPIPIQVFKGERGVQGLRGRQGSKGQRGERGLKGERGALGPRGDIGPIGPIGPQGIRGLVGEQGPAGNDGADGRDGTTPDVKPIEDKFKRLFDEFKGTVSAQITRMAYANGPGSSSGSGEVRLLRLDDVDTTDLADGKFLRYNATKGKLEFVESSVSLDLSNHDGHIIPSANNTFDLGSPQRQWRDLYLSGTSLFINGVPAISQDPSTGNIVLAANTVVTSSNGQNNLVASQPNLDVYMQVANVAPLITTEINNLVDGAPAALDTLNEIAAAISDDGNFAGAITATLGTKASNNYVNTSLANKASNAYVNTNLATKASNAYVNTQLNLKANSTDLNNYLQVANNFSGVYSDLTGKPNLDIYASNTALQLKANTTDLSTYLQVANVSSLITAQVDSVIDAAPGALDTLNELAAALGDDANFATTITTSLASKASNTYINTQLSSKADASDLNKYLQVANNFSGVYSDLTGKPNLDVYASNTALQLKANSTDLNNYLQVANNFSGVYNDLTGKPNLDVYASNTALQLKANSSDLNNYLQVANNFSGVYSDLTGKPVLDVYAANTYVNTQLGTKANASDLNSYLQVANNKSIVAGNNVTVTTNATSIVINGTTAPVNLDPYLQVANVNSLITAQVNNVIDAAPGTLDTLNELAAALGDDANFVTTVTTGLASKASNTYVNNQLATKANSSDLNNYLQVANTFSGVYSDLAGKPNLDIYASNTALQLKANSSDLNNYLQVANTTNLVSTTQNHGSGQSLIKSKINNVLTLNTLKAGPNITIEENSDGEIKISATGSLSVSDSLDFGFVNNDFGSITDNADSDPQFDFGNI